MDRHLELEAILEQLLASQSPTGRAMGRLAATDFHRAIISWLNAEAARGTRVGEALIAMTKLFGGLVGTVMQRANPDPPDREVLEALSGIFLEGITLNWRGEEATK